MNYDQVVRALAVFGVWSILAPGASRPDRRAGLSGTAVPRIRRSLSGRRTVLDFPRQQDVP